MSGCKSPGPLLTGLIVGWELFVIIAVVRAVPALAMVRILYDFLRVRLCTRE